MIKKVIITHDRNDNSITVESPDTQDWEVLGLLEMGKEMFMDSVKKGWKNASTSADQSDNNGVDNSVS